MQQTLLILCAGLLLLGVGGRAVEPIAATGASIHGRAADLTLYVAPKGNDGADGSEDKPLKTVGKAVELAAKASDAGKQVGILIEDGTYRERVVLPKGVAN